mmetsp:Transcript_32624/g.84251  ORF Transcript_32624/g.84251 Transcript_32624/m.84251 type:complete len:109 (+) Transcript_32624:422-748(+)
MVNLSLTILNGEYQRKVFLNLITLQQEELEQSWHRLGKKDLTSLSYYFRRRHPRLTEPILLNVFRKSRCTSFGTDVLSRASRSKNTSCQGFQVYGYNSEGSEDARRRG